MSISVYNAGKEQEYLLLKFTLNHKTCILSLITVNISSNNYHVTMKVCRVVLTVP